MAEPTPKAEDQVLVNPNSVAAVRISAIDPANLGAQRNVSILCNNGLVLQAPQDKYAGSELEAFVKENFVALS